MGFEILRDLLQLCFQVSQGWNGVVICTLQVAWGLDDVKCSAKHGAGLAGSAQERVAIWGGGVLLFQRFLTWKVVRSQNPNFSHRGSSLRAKSYFFKGWGPRLGIDSVSQGALRLQERPRGFPANLNTVFKDTYFYTQGLQACFISQPSGDSVWGRGGGVMMPHRREKFGSDPSGWELPRCVLNGVLPLFGQGGKGGCKQVGVSFLHPWLPAPSQPYCGKSRVQVATADWPSPTPHLLEKKIEHSCFSSRGPPWRMLTSESRWVWSASSYLLLKAQKVYFTNHFKRSGTAKKQYDSDKHSWHPQEWVGSTSNELII